MSYTILSIKSPSQLWLIDILFNIQLLQDMNSTNFILLHFTTQLDFLIPNDTKQPSASPEGHRGYKSGPDT